MRCYSTAIGLNTLLDVHAIKLNWFKPKQKISFWRKFWLKIFFLKKITIFFEKKGSKFFIRAKFNYLYRFQKFKFRRKTMPPTWPNKNIQQISDRFSNVGVINFFPFLVFQQNWLVKNRPKIDFYQVVYPRDKELAGCYIGVRLSEVCLVKCPNNSRIVHYVS